jgi:hypothetical protein
MTDPMLGMALANVEATARGAVRAAKAGDYGTAALEFSQASMVLGMQIGHQRVRLGPRYPGSPEARAIDAAASRLTTSITLAYVRPTPTVTALQDEDDEPSDDDIEIEEAYGRWGSTEEDE